MTEYRPLIGLSGRRKSAGSMVGMPDVLAGLEGDWYYGNYALGVLEAGGLPVNLPSDVDPELFVGRLDGILLSGGTDIGAQNYGAESDAAAYPAEATRDEFELALLAGATKAAVPVLGICRGLQMINVFAGGTLHQHVPEHARSNDPPTLLAHAVKISAGSVMSDLYGESLDVNSLHHQTVDRLGADLNITATSDGTVEALEHASLPIVAVQWHPEMLETRSTDPIFGWLIDQARDYRGTQG